jgi:hypothetical protein
MTIALGILTFRGLVVAADTLETASGYWKGDQGKIRWLEYHTGPAGDPPNVDGACIVSGAGRSGSVDVLSQHILETFEDDKAGDSMADLRAKFEAALSDYYARDVVPFTSSGDSHMDLGLQMVVAVQRSRQMELWTQ